MEDNYSKDVRRANRLSEFARPLALYCFMAAWALVQPFSLLASPPVNDAFSNRVDLQLSQPVTGTLDGATKEANEPDLLGDWRSGFHAQHPVWWNWVSTVNTSVCVVAMMQQTRPVLMVWQGTDLSQQVGTLTFQNPLSQNGTNFYTTEVRFTASAGSNYLIAVDAQEPLTLMWDPNPETNLGGYRLYIRTNGGGESIIDIGNVTSQSLWDFLPGAAGFHFKVTAYDKGGRESQPSQELLTDTPGLNPTGEMRLALTLPPSITITAPANDSQFATGTELTLQALASDPDGSVDHVEYYIRPEMGASTDQLLGTATVAPYPMTLTNLETGRYLVSARAYDDLGSSTASEPVLIVVGAPANDRFVDRIALPNTGVTAGTTEAAGKEANEPSNLSGNVSTRSVWWSWISTASAARSAIITTRGEPALAGVFTGDSITNVSEVSAVSAITPVYSNDVFYYRTEASFTAAAGLDYAIAVDSHGSPFTFEITTPPSIAITLPADGSAVFAHTNLVLRAHGADSDGTLSQVNYYYEALDGRKGLIGSSSVAPDFEVVWNQIPTGRYTITAAGVDDVGAQTLSTAISLTVGLAPNDNFANRITIDGPPYFTNVTQFVAGKEPGEPDAIASISLNRTVWWSWTAPSNGLWAAVATAPNAIPLLGVYAGSSVSNLIQVSDLRTGDGVYSNAVAYTTSEAHFTAVAGTRYAIVVDASDQAFTLAITAPPSVSISSPVNNFDVLPGSGVEVNVDTADRDGFVTRVEYSYDSDIDTGVLFAIVSSPPFTLDWSEIPVGAYRLTARAVDNTGASTVSAPIRITSGRPANDDFANRLSLFGSPAFAHASNLAANMESSEPDYVGPKAGHTIWWSWTATFSGRHLVIASAENVTPVVGVFTGATLTNLTLIGHPAFRAVTFVDGNYVLSVQSTFDAVAGNTYVVMVDSSYGPGADLDLIVTAAPQVRLSRPANGVNFSPNSVVTFAADAIDLDGAVDSLAFWSGPDGLLRLAGTTPTAPYLLSITNMPPGVYTVEARARDDVGAEGISDDVVFTIGAAPNDQFTNRIRLTGNSVIAHGSNYISTREPGEPRHAGQDGQNSVWWSWSAPSSGTYIISTEGSSFPTLLGIYLGPAVSNLTSVASAAFNADYNTSALELQAAAGKTYQIAVDGFVGAEGDIVLSIQRSPPPQNDSFSARTIISGFPAHVSGHNTNATSEAGESEHVGNAPARSVWWSWTAPAAGVATIDTLGSSFDTVLGIYVGSAVGTLTTIAEDDDSGDSTTSRASFVTEANATYQIVVDGFGGAFGKVNLSLDFVPDALTIAGLSISTAGSVALRFEGAESQQVIIEASDDLQEWFPVNTNIVTGGKVSFIDYTWGQLPHRFYRAVLDLAPPPFALTGWSGSGGNFNFEVQESEGAQFVIEASEDLGVWRPISTNTVSGGRIRFSESRHAGARFYRGSRRL